MHKSAPYLDFTDSIVGVDPIAGFDIQMADGRITRAVELHRTPTRT
ncbi:hypothetical protein ACFLS8_05410 [Chloroflexota bacterium]